MSIYSKMLPKIENRDYETHFWNAMRGKAINREILNNGVEPTTGAYTISPRGQETFMSAIKEESIFRNLAADMRIYDHDSRIKTVSTDDVAVWVPEGGSIPIQTGIGDFSDITIAKHKIAVFLKLENTLVCDPFFNLENYLVKRLAKNFGRAEDYGFINGNGKESPAGILSENGGAQIGVAADKLTFDNVVNLFFSVKPEYRKHGTWLMNDETALALRSLKDNAGQPIWNQADDTILGHKVCISEFMPAAESGSKPIAFGDFSYYWIICRRPVSIRTLTEQFTNVDCIGYLAYELLDGKLVRPEAIKVMQITD